MMKKFFYILVVVAMAMVACSKSDDMPSSDIPEGKGVVMFAVAPQTTISTRATVELSTLGVTVPAVSDMTLSITSPASAYPGETPFSFTGKVGDYNKDAKRTYLEASDEPYIAEVSAGNAEAEGVDKPYFESRNADGGKQIPFTVAARTQSRVDITAKMVKAMVQVKFSDAFKGYFGEGAELTLTTAAGAKFAFSYDNTGADTGIAKPIFVLAGAGKSFTIDGWAIKQRPAANVDPVKLAFQAVGRDGSTGNEVKEQTIYTYTYDVADAGYITVKVEITNEPIQEIPVITKELNDDAVMGDNN